MTNAPNIFKYANSELSFDAFLSWLFEWSKKENEKINADLYQCSKNLLQVLMPNSDNLHFVEVHKQLYRADVIVELENDIILIENKVGSWHSAEQSRAEQSKLNDIKNV